jgi:hypothetical protein
MRDRSVESRQQPVGQSVTVIALFGSGSRKLRGLLGEPAANTRKYEWSHCGLRSIFSWPSTFTSEKPGAHQPATAKAPIVGTSGSCEVH